MTSELLEQEKKVLFDKVQDMIDDFGEKHGVPETLDLCADVTYAILTKAVANAITYGVQGQVEEYESIDNALAMVEEVVSKGVQAGIDLSLPGNTIMCECIIDTGEPETNTIQ